ncbi:MAG: T9SS type A sorting domain-containing protein [candidate division Zixibacteria bacterium]|nr:T9SS type A sorting domain-containing protein [candidate division Zixibacteria bacterium]
MEKKMTQLKQIRLSITIIAAVALMFAFGSNVNAYTSYSTLFLDIDGLEDLGEDYMYEGWVIVDEMPISTGVFSVDENGNLSQTEFLIDDEYLDNAAKFVLTIEPYPDNDPSPAATHILAGDFEMDDAELTVGNEAALGDDFMDSEGNYILATPTNGPETDENSGIWFLDLTSGEPMQGLFLPTLPDGWKYEGWAVIDGIPVTSGTFLDPNAADEEAPYSGNMEGPPFPGEDYLHNPPEGLDFPTDLAGGMAVISIEPYPDNSEAPFTLKPLAGMIPADAEDHVTYMMDLNLESFPSGMATRAENDVSIDMIPDDDPIVVPAGDEFTYTGFLLNNTSESQNVDVWIMLDVEGYGMYGPVQGYSNIPLTPNQVMGFTGITQDVPNNSVLGTHEYIAFVGEYDYMVTDMVSFPFTIVAPRGEDADSWALAGWFEEDNAIENTPSSVSLIGNYPNPFNAQTSISFEIPAASDVKLDIYNIKGQRVSTLVNGRIDAGKHTVSWDASDYSSGVYFYNLSAGDKVVTKRMTLLK